MVRIMRPAGSLLGNRLARQLSMPPGMKKLSDAFPKKSIQMLRDDLWYDHQRSEPFENVVLTLRNNPSRELSARAVGFTLFHMGIVKKYDAVVNDILERYVEKYRGTYNPRLAFGALSGGLRCNIKPFCIRVFLEDCMEHQKSYSRPP